MQLVRDRYQSLIFFIFLLGFAPAPTQKVVVQILQEQPTVNLQGTPTTMKARGRHDPCVLPRAVPIVEAMAAMVTLDYMLLQKTIFNI